MVFIGQRYGRRGLLENRSDETKDGSMSISARHATLAEGAERPHVPRHGRDAAAIRATPNRKARQPRPAGVHDYWAAWVKQRCPHAGASLVEYYMAGHVRKIAERMRATLPNHVDVDDLVQQGYLGLIDAMKRFDPGRGIRFETFSSQRITGSMQDWLRSLDHVPRLMRRRAKLVQQVVERFRAMHGRVPDRAELQERLNLPEDEFQRVVGEDVPPVVVTISTVSASGEDDPVSLPERQGTSPSHASQRRDLRGWITRDLDPIDRMIVSLYYYESLTMKEVGVALGCSESRVSQRLDSILKRLRARVDLTPERLLAFAG
jgi:RNA polymerase sigma factor for flagellar operon FliA